MEATNAHDAGDLPISTSTTNSSDGTRPEIIANAGEPTTPTDPNGSTITADQAMTLAKWQRFYPEIPEKDLRFSLFFAPKDGVDYAWVLKLARDKNAFVESQFKEADTKASAIVAMLGSGAGILTLGSLAAISIGKLDAWVAFSAMPAFFAASLALIFATIARQVETSSELPMADQMVPWAESKPPATAEAATIGAIHLATHSLQLAVRRKLWWYQYATWMAVAAVALLAMPAIISLMISFEWITPRTKI